MDRAFDRIRAQAFNLLERRRSELSLTYLFIARTVISGVGVAGSAG
jgi:ABC-type oligopeptide transport system ATPase subunit